MKNIFLLLIAITIMFSCSEKRLYPQDGIFYSGEKSSFEIGAIFFGKYVDIFLSDTVDSAYYIFEIHPIIVSSKLNFWSGQLIYQGHKTTDGFHNSMSIFELDFEHGGITFNFSNDDLICGGVILNLADSDRVNEICGVYEDYIKLIDPENFGYMRSADGWGEEF